MEIIEAPIFTAVEEKNDQDCGIAQCAAPLAGIQKYNPMEGYEMSAI